MNPQGIAYLKIIKDIFTYATPVPKFGDGINEEGYMELLNYHIDIDNPTREPVIIGIPDRDCVVKNYTEKEQILFDEGNIHEMDTISKFWKKSRIPTELVTQIMVIWYTI